MIAGECPYDGLAKMMLRPHSGASQVGFIMCFTYFCYPFGVKLAGLRLFYKDHHMFVGETMPFVWFNDRERSALFVLLSLQRWQHKTKSYRKP